MEPITHLMTGACLARAGFNRKAAYATLAMTLAAEAPDLDTLWGIAGPVASFQHHRGITHTLVGMPFEAAAIVGVMWGLHRLRLQRKAPEKKLTAAPVRWGMLWGLVMVALASHLLLDYTNNYGVRPFFPFNPRWYAGSIVFIFEPLIFVALLAGLLVPGLLGLIGGEVGVRKKPFRGRGWALAALLAVVAVWNWRFLEQQKAIRLAGQIDLSANQATGSEAVAIERIFANPYPINPYKWHMIVETRDFYQLSTADVLAGTLSEPQSSDVLYRGGTTLATLAAKRSRLGEAYLDWSMFPLVTETVAPTPENGGESEITFRDLRFFYDVPFMKGRTHPPLTGKVNIDSERRVVAMEMNGQPEKTR